MFNQLFKQPAAVSRHINAPLLEDRLRFLTYRAERGTPQSYLCEIARHQITAIKYLGLEHNGRIITNKELQNAAKRWAHDELQCFCEKEDHFSSKDRFCTVTQDWLEFLGRMESSEQPLPSQVTKYIDHMRKEKGLSEATIFYRRSILQEFFTKIKEGPGQFLDNLTPAYFDTLQVKEFRQGALARSTIQNRCTVLRGFFRFAEHRGWCRLGIADSIHSPRVYKHENLPSGPSLEEIKRLLRTTEGNRPIDIRDRAIISLLVIYGFRASEVMRLRIEDIDWNQERFCLRHSKRGPVQQFPLTQTVGRALAQYLKKIRPKSSTHGEIFLTLRAPFRPLDNLSNSLYARWKRIGIGNKHHGAHSLRHACATRLINQGVSLKTIADQLGHRDLDTTRIYAKMNLPSLREVANFDLRGVL